MLPRIFYFILMFHQLRGIFFFHKQGISGDISGVLCANCWVLLPCWIRSLAHNWKDYYVQRVEELTLFSWWGLTNVAPSKLGTNSLLPAHSEFDTVEKDWLSQREINDTLVAINAREGLSKCPYFMALLNSSFFLLLYYLFQFPKFKLDPSVSMRVVVCLL